MQSKCSGECCDPKLGNQPSAQLFSESKCACWREKLECGTLCSCDPEICNNRQMSLNQQLVLGEDVEERTAWGIDLSTAINLLAIMPRDMPMMQQSEFIENKLMFAIQQ